MEKIYGNQKRQTQLYKIDVKLKKNKEILHPNVHCNIIYNLRHICPSTGEQIKYFGIQIKTHTQWDTIKYLNEEILAIILSKIRQRKKKLYNFTYMQNLKQTTNPPDSQEKILFVVNYNREQGNWMKVVKGTNFQL